MSKTKKSAELTLRDRLSRLSLAEAKKLLGPTAEQRLRGGGKYEIDLENDVSLDSSSFELRLDDATVRIFLSSDSTNRLGFSCSSCRAKVCDHVGVALSLLLEEKVGLGLARPPEERVPLELLDHDQLLHRVLSERARRASEEKMTLRSSDPTQPFTDYVVTNAASGKSYKIALRGLGQGASFCSCPDFKKNTLGTCKHILRVEDEVRRKFSKSALDTPPVRLGYTVHLVYGQDLELRLSSPTNPHPGEAAVVGDLSSGPIDDPAKLLRCIEGLEAMGADVTIYPDAEEYLHRLSIQGRISRLCDDIAAAPSTHPLRDKLLKQPLLPYQLQGVAFAARAGRSILADEMGLGKTIQAIGVAELLAREGAVRRVLVVCPTSLKSQWRGEVERFCDRSVQLVQGSAKERARQYDSEAFFTVCNYEQVLRDILFIEKASWDLIVLDEGQRIKNWEARTSRIIKGLRSTFALVLSGTPLENNLDELFSVAEFVDDRRLGPAFRFFNRHRVVDDKGRVIGLRDLGEVRRALCPILLRRTRDSVLGELPPRTLEYVRITPTAEQKHVHGANMMIVNAIIRKKYFTEMDLLRLRKALLMCRMAANATSLVDKQEPNHSSKLAALEELLGRLAAEPRRKIVLFSEWTSMLDLIEPLLAKAGLGFARLDGSVPQKQRAELVSRFHKDPSCRVFATTNAGSTGLNLQAADTVINVDLPWNPAVLEQRIARAHRMGQQRPVHVYVLVTEDTIEDKLLCTLAAKKELSLAVLDTSSDIDFVQLDSGGASLRHKLEELLGARPEAPLDETSKSEAEASVAREEQRRKMSVAGGQLISAAFAFLAEIVPPRQPNDEGLGATVAQELLRKLEGCLERDDEGRVQLTVTLPDPKVLDGLSQAIASLMGEAASKSLSN
jgi:superfamily II DNA or RNA helicase